MRITFEPKVSIFITLFCICVFGLKVYYPIEFDQYFVLDGKIKSQSLAWYISTMGYIFGHADMKHLIGNLSFFLLLSPIVEKQIGSAKYLLMVVTTAVITGIIHIVFEDNGLLGLSGIVFMLIILSTLLHIKSKEIPFTFILIFIFYLGQEVFLSFAKDNVSHMAHLTGGILGIFWGFYKRKGGN